MMIVAQRCGHCLHQPCKDVLEIILVFVHVKRKTVVDHIGVAIVAPDRAVPALIQKVHCHVVKQNERAAQAASHVLMTMVHMVFKLGKQDKRVAHHAFLSLPTGRVMTLQSFSKRGDTACTHGGHLFALRVNVLVDG